MQFMSPYKSVDHLQRPTVQSLFETRSAHKGQNRYVTVQYNHIPVFIAELFSGSHSSVQVLRT